MPDYKRFWFSDSPDGWYAAYISPFEPHLVVHPLMGVALEVDGDGAPRMVGISGQGSTEILPCDDPDVLGADWQFIGYFLRGSMTEEREQQYFNDLRKKGKEMGAALEAETKRPQFERRGRSSRRAR